VVDSKLGIQMLVPARFIENNRRVHRPTGDVLYTLVREVHAAGEVMVPEDDKVLLVKPTGGVAGGGGTQLLRVEYETVKEAIADLRRIEKLRAKELKHESNTHR